MQSYLKLLSALLQSGEVRPDRTQTGTRSIFGECQLTHDMSRGFPLLTTKRVSFRNIVTELMWFMRGDTNIKFLHDFGCKIWDEWADERGDLGAIYGRQWRDWRGLRFLGEHRVGGGHATLPGIEQTYQPVRIDQIQDLVNGLIENPYGRRHIVTAWNPADAPHLRLPACHAMFQCYVHTDKRLDLKMFQRSADVMLGVPYNIASYALLLTMLAHTCGYTPGKLFITYGDLHLYSNHEEQAHLQLSREPRELPKVWLRDVHPGMALEEYTHDHFVLEDYTPHDAIKAPVAV